MWVTTVGIVVPGVSAGAAFLYFMEPAMGSLADPGSYYVAVFADFLTLILSVIVNTLVTVHFLIRNRETRRPT